MFLMIFLSIFIAFTSNRYEPTRRFDGGIRGDAVEPMKVAASNEEIFSTDKCFVEARCILENLVVMIIT